MKKIFYILMLLTLSNSAFAQNKCAQLFEVSRQQQIETQIQKNMKRYGYIQAGESIFKVDSTGLQTYIGEVKVIKPQYLFEWADQDMHDYWKSNGKYTKADMDFTLKQPGQVTGRGYYVSTNPIDSENYGTHLTIFKVNEPLLIINKLNNQFYNDQKTLNELRKIGFSGNQGIIETWFNIFNEKTLSEIVTINQNILNDIENLTPHASDILIAKPQFVKFFKNTLVENFTQLSAKTITDSDLVRLIKYASTLKTNPYTLENIDYILLERPINVVSDFIYYTSKAPYREKLVQQWMLRFIRSAASPSDHARAVFKEFSAENKLVLTQAEFDRLGKKFDSDNNPSWALGMNLAIK
jgi:hypothetical protein